MKKLIAAIMIAPLLLLASCGGSNDIIGKWKFSDVNFPNGAPKEATPEQIGEMKEMFKNMSYDFKEDKTFTFTSAMSDQPIKGTYKVNDKNLSMTVEGKEEHFIIEELTSDKLVIEMKEAGGKKEDRFQMVFTK